jgi:hypothetical protein
MRQILLASVLLLGASWMAAQTSSGSTQGGQSGGDYGQTNSGQTSGNGGAQKTVVGCLSQSNGQYMLTSKRGMTYQLTGDTSQLSDHVGHEIRVTGTEGQGSASAGSNSGMSQGSAGATTLQISSMKHISKTCNNTGGTVGGNGEVK